MSPRASAFSRLMLVRSAATRPRDVGCHRPSREGDTLCVSPQIGIQRPSTPLTTAPLLTASVRGCGLALAVAPLTSLEVIATRVDGCVLLVELRPTINQKNQTVDAFISAMRSSYLQFLDRLMEVFQRSHVPPSALLPLRTLHVAAKKREAGWFISAQNYMSATRQALDAKEDIFADMASPTHWTDGHGKPLDQNTLVVNQRLLKRPQTSSTSREGVASSVALISSGAVDSSGGALSDAEPPASRRAHGSTETPSVIAERMFVAAQLCASERGCGLVRGKEGHAISLLLLSLRVCPAEEGVHRHPRLRQQDYVAVRTLLDTNAEARDEDGDATDSSLTPRSPSSSRRTPSVSHQSPYKPVSEATSETTAHQRLIIAQMLLVNGDLAKWASTLVTLLSIECMAEGEAKHDSSQEHDLILQCFVQLLDKSGLINHKPITIGRRLLVRRSADDEWVEGRLLAVKKSNDVRSKKANTLFVMQLLNGDHVTARDVLPFGSTDAGVLLRAGAAAGATQLVHALLEAGVHPLSADEDATVPLELAVQHGYVDVCTLLIDQGGKSQKTFVNRRGFKVTDWALMPNPTTGQPQNPLVRLAINPSDATVEIDSSIRQAQHNKISLMLQLIDAPDGLSGDGKVLQSILKEYDHDQLRQAAGAVTDAGVTPLMLAAYYGYPQTMIKLIAAGADVTSCTVAKRITALTFAAEFGHRECVEALIHAARGASGEPIAALHELVNHREENGATALIRACQNAHVDVVRLLIDGDAVVDAARFDQYRTPLIMASRVGSVESVRLLLAKRADSTLSDQTGFTALNHAAKFGHTEIVRLLATHRARHEAQEGEAGFVDDGCNQDGILGLSWMRVDTKPEHGRELKNERLSQILASGRTNLKYDEIREFDVDGLRADSFIVAGEVYYKPSTRSNKVQPGFGHINQTPLILAARFGHDDVVRQLLGLKADPSISDGASMTALMWASKNGYELPIPHLLAESLFQEATAKVQLNALDSSRLTALMYACTGLYNGVAEILVENDADVNIKGHDQLTALMVACRAGATKELIRTLLHGAETMARVAASSRSEDEGLSDALVARGTQLHVQGVIDAQDEHQMTALMLAARHGHPRTVRALLQEGADRYITDSEGLTAQMHAVAQSSGSNLNSTLVATEFHTIYRELSTAGPPLCALRHMNNFPDLNAEALFGCASLVFDMGTGGGKVIAWFRFDAVTMHEVRRSACP